MTTTIREAKVKTAKARYCWGCGAKQAVGVEMTVSVSVDNGRIMSTYWCQRCDTFLRTLDSRDNELGYVFAGLLEYDNYPRQEGK